MRFQPIDIIAILIIICATILKGLGIDDVVSSILLWVTGYYFGKKASGYRYSKVQED